MRPAPPAALGAIALLGVLPGCTCAPEPTLQPNVVIVLVDTLRSDHLGVHGYARPTSPRIDAFAAQGLDFRRAFAQSGWTLASTTSLLTGLYPHQHRVVRDPAHHEAFGCLVPEVHTVAEAMQDARYATAAFINNTFLAPEFGLNQGFGRYDYQGATNSQHRTAADTVEAALAWWDAQGEQRRFAVVHFMEPHLHYEAPIDLQGRFVPATPPAGLAPTAERPDPMLALQYEDLVPDPESRAWLIGRYDEEILAVDRAFGALLDGLDARGAQDQTLVVFTADHGEEFWDHGKFEHGHALWSELTRVPLLVRGPGVPSAQVDTVVEHVDLVRGLLARTGAQVPEGLGGADLFSLLGPYQERSAMSEDCLNGPTCLDLVTRDYRLSANLDTARAAVFPVLAPGVDGPQRGGAEEDAAGQRLMAELIAKRGDLEPTAAVSGGPRVPSADTFAQLAQLGYIDVPNPGEAGPTPCGK
jgi:arylsulfatase A-like enzyme